MKTLKLPVGTPLPVLGQDTCNMGDAPSKRRSEIEALQRGIDLGLTLIDTAEMYGDGASEELVGSNNAGHTFPPVRSEALGGDRC